MAEKIYLASKESIDSLSTDISSIKTTLETVSTNVNTANTNINSIKTTVGTINTNASNASTYSLNVQNRLGTSTDTASQTGTTVQSKLKYVANTIGSTNDTGGTQTGGTAMAKLNNIINTTEGTNTRAANLITTVGTYNDTANTVGSLSAKINFMVNSIGSTSETSSTTGSVNAKLKYTNNTLDSRLAPIYHLFELFYGSQTGGSIHYELNIDGAHSGSTYYFYYYFPFPTFNPVIRLKSYSSTTTLYLTQGIFYNLGGSMSATNCNLGSSFSSGFTQSSPLYICPQGGSTSFSFPKKNNNYVRGAKANIAASSTSFYPKGFLFRGLTSGQSDDFYVGFYGGY